MIVTSDCECGNGKNVQQVGDMHFRMDVDGDKPVYCYYFMVKVVSEGEEGEVKLDIHPDPDLEGEFVDFAIRRPTVLWIRQGEDKYWYRLDKGHFVTTDEVRKVRFNIKEDETLFVSYLPASPYSETVAWLEELWGENKENSRLTSIGRSFQGRDIPCLRITEGNSNEDKKRILVIAGQHAIEFPGVWAVRGISEFLLSEILDARKLRENHVVDLIPITNPDGNVLGRNGFNAESKDLGRCFEGCSEGREATAHEGRILWRWITDNVPDLYLNFHCYAQPRDHGVSPYEGVYITAPDIFTDERSKKIQRCIIDYMKFRTDGLSQCRDYIRRRPDNLQYQLAKAFGTVGVLYELNGCWGPHGNVRTGINVFETLVKAYEDGYSRV